MKGRGLDRLRIGVGRTQSGKREAGSCGDEDPCGDADPCRADAE